MKKLLMLLLVFTLVLSSVLALSSCGVNKDKKLSVDDEKNEEVEYYIERANTEYSSITISLDDAWANRQAEGHWLIASIKKSLGILPDGKNITDDDLVASLAAQMSIDGTFPGILDIEKTFCKKYEENLQTGDRTLVSEHLDLKLTFNVLNNDLDYVEAISDNVFITLSD